MSTVLDPPRPKEKPRERTRDDVTRERGGRVCHILSGDNRPLCGASSIHGVWAEYRDDRGGHCAQCGLRRCPACMEFVA